MFPLILDLTGRLAVVIGGGPVGRRKASAVLASGGRVRLVCHETRPPEMSDPHLDWRTESYSAEHLDGAALVFAAGPPGLNARVVADARARGVWVNAASEPEQGDFILPAVVRRSDLLLAVSTGGAAPLLAQAIRDRLEAEFDKAFAEWVALLSEMRALVTERVADEDRRRELLTRLCQWEWLERLRRERFETVRMAMRAAVEAASRGPE